MIDLILLIAITVIAYYSFQAGAKFGTVANFVKAGKEKVKSWLN